MNKLRQREREREREREEFVAECFRKKWGIPREGEVVAESSRQKSRHPARETGIGSGVF